MGQHHLIVHLLAPHNSLGLMLFRTTAVAYSPFFFGPARKNATSNLFFARHSKFRIIFTKHFNRGRFENSAVHHIVIFPFSYIRIYMRPMGWRLLVVVAVRITKKKSKNNTQSKATRRRAVSRGVRYRWIAPPAQSSYYFLSQGRLRIMFPITVSGNCFDALRCLSVSFDAFRCLSMPCDASVGAKDAIFTIEMANCDCILHIHEAHNTFISEKSINIWETPA